MFQLAACTGGWRGVNPLVSYRATARNRENGAFRVLQYICRSTSKHDAQDSVCCGSRSDRPNPGAIQQGNETTVLIACSEFRTAAESVTASVLTLLILIVGWSSIFLKKNQNAPLDLLSIPQSGGKKKITVDEVFEGDRPRGCIFQTFPSLYLEPTNGEKLCSFQNVSKS